MARNGDFGEFDLLRQLTNAAGVPGREERIREIVTEATRGMWDETNVDAMGNLICLKKAAGRSSGSGKSARKTTKPKKVMIACHMDEIGFYVRYIDDEGRLRVQNVGGFDTRNLFARRVLVQGKRDLIGVMNPVGKPVHLASEEEKKKIPSVSEFFIDLFLPKAEVAKLVRMGSGSRRATDANYAVIFAISARPANARADRISERR